LSEEKKLEVRLKYGDLEVNFSGNIDDVIGGIFKFLSEIYPTYEALSRITLSLNVEDILRSIEGIIAKTPEGLVLLTDRSKLTDKENIGLHLLRAHLYSKLGLSESTSLTIGEILKLTKGKPGAIAGRLSELVSEGFVERVGKGEYRITTIGIKYLLDNVIPKYKAKIGKR
jgi:hypothetical protein